MSPEIYARESQEEECLAGEHIPCILIPCFNHVGRLVPLFPSIRSFGLPIIVVDDGCKSEDYEFLRAACDLLPDVTLIRHEQNLGKGAALKTGIRCAIARGYTHAVQIDADGQHSLSDLPNFLSHSRRCPSSVVVGAPIFDSSAPLVRRWGRLLSVVLVWLETGSRMIRDPLCGFRVYPVQSTNHVIEHNQIHDRMGFDPDILVKLVWTGVSVQSIPTKVTYPERNTSNFRYIADNFEMVRLHVHLILSLLARKRRVAEGE